MLFRSDLETALREPERVRHVDGLRARQVAHFPGAHKDVQLVVQFEGHDDTLHFFEVDCEHLFLAPKTRKVWVRIMGCGDGEFDTHISLHPACQEALPVGWRWLDSGPTEIEIREDA